MYRNYRHRVRKLAILVALALPLSAVADEQYDQLKQQLDSLQKQLSGVKEALASYKAEGATRVEVAEEVADLREGITQATEWKEPNTLIHMAGYAAAGYAGGDSTDGTFNIGSFSPIFHYQYRDKVMLESEVEFNVADDGSSHLTLEYMSVDLFLNDNVTLVMGSFLSPVGQFRQNLHPSWINKLATAPPGFGHDGAAPTSELGIEARGGFHLGGNVYLNYAAFAGNGPELNATIEDGEYELEGIVAEGFGADRDGHPVVGGRIGILPFPGLEVGFSAETGKATVTAIELEQDQEAPAIDLSGENGRDYDVLGADFAWGRNNLRLRGEYIKSKIGGATSGVTASSGATWTSKYVQASYLIPETKWEPVLRYTDFDSPHASQDQKQLAIGLNYLFAASVIGKFSYEFNDGQSGNPTDSNRWMIQLGYGF